MKGEGLLKWSMASEWNEYHTAQSARHLPSLGKIHGRSTPPQQGADKIASVVCVEIADPPAKITKLN
jgi:hypothetical protein